MFRVQGHSWCKFSHCYYDVFVLVVAGGVGAGALVAGMKVQNGFCNPAGTAFGI